MLADCREKRGKRQRLGEVSRSQRILDLKHTDDHGRAREWQGCRVRTTADLASGTAKLGVELHADIGAVLRLCLTDVSNVHHLREHSESALHALL